jgi:hypothetical protein
MDPISLLTLVPFTTIATIIGRLIYQNYPNDYNKSRDAICKRIKEKIIHGIDVDKDIEFIELVNVSMNKLDVDIQDKINKIVRSEIRFRSRFNKYEHIPFRVPSIKRNYTKQRIDDVFHYSIHNNKDTFLVYCVKVGCDAMVNYIFSNLKIGTIKRVVDHNGNNLLMNLVTYDERNKRYDLIKKLIDNGNFDLNLVNNNGNTLFIFAVKHNSELKVINLLMENNVNPFIKNNHGDTALNIVKEFYNAKKCLLDKKIYQYKIKRRCKYLYELIQILKNYEDTYKIK